MFLAIYHQQVNKCSPFHNGVSCVQPPSSLTMAVCWKESLLPSISLCSSPCKVLRASAAYVQSCQPVGCWKMSLLPAGRRCGDNFRKEHAATVLGGSRCHSYLPAAQRWLKDQMDSVTAWLCVAILALQGWLHG